jgi:hypothetical protein
MGRVLAGIVADSCGWHDPFGGVLNAEETRKIWRRTLPGFA